MGSRQVERRSGMHMSAGRHVVTTRRPSQRPLARCPTTDGVLCLISAPSGADADTGICECDDFSASGHTAVRGQRASRKGTKMKLRWTTVPAALVGVVASLVVAAPSASAAPAARHCWSSVDSPEQARCFTNLAAVANDISGGDVQISATSTTFSDAERQAIAISPLATYIIGQVWADDNYTDASWTFTASGDCDTNADVDWNVGSMPSGWNDRVTSFKSYGLCATKIWENTNYGGASLGFYVNRTYVGDAMNDRTSSIQWN